MKISLPALILLCTFRCPVSAEKFLFVGSSFPHILEETSAGNFQGVGADIAKDIVEELGHTIEIKLYPWARAQHMLKIGKADVLIGPYKTANNVHGLKRTAFL